MCNNRVSTIDNDGIIPTLIEHSHRNTQHRSIIHIPVQCTFVRADYHEFIRCCPQVRNVVEHCLQYLIRRYDIVEAHQRNSIANSRVMCIKCNDIGNAHLFQFLQCTSTVQRFSVVSPVLSATVENRHDDIDTVCLTAGSLNDSL